MSSMKGFFVYGLDNTDQIWTKNTKNLVDKLLNPFPIATNAMMLPSGRGLGIYAINFATGSE